MIFMGFCRDAHSDIVEYFRGSNGIQGDKSPAMWSKGLPENGSWIMDHWLVVSCYSLLDYLGWWYINYKLARNFQGCSHQLAYWESYLSIGKCMETLWIAEGRLGKNVTTRVRNFTSLGTIFRKPSYLMTKQHGSRPISTKSSIDAA
jgi:hypothetical protein